jgi:phage tail sheath protein FI
MAADKIVSPGVFTRENDLSYLPTGISQIGAAIVGPTEYGPSFLPKIVTTQQEYEQIFGLPTDYYTGYAAQNYLREAGTLTVVKVGGLGGYRLGGGLVVEAVSASAKQITAVLAPSSSKANGINTFFGSNLGSGSFAITASGGTLIASSSVLVSSAVSVDDVFGTNPFFGKAAYAYAYFDVTVTGSALYGANTDKITTNFYYLDSYANNNNSQDFTDDATYASTPWIQSQLFGSSRYNLFRVHTLSDGNVENVRFKVQISNVKASDGTNYGTFTLTLRAYDDTDKRKTILETYSGLDLDPDSPNFIARRIGDRQTTIDSSGKITETGNFGNISKYIRIEAATEGTYPLTAVPFANAAYQLPVNLGTSGSLLQAVTFTTASVSSTTNPSGFDFSNNNNLWYLAPIPTSAGNGANAVFSLDTTCGLTLSTNTATDLSQRTFVVAFQEGFDGKNPTTPNYTNSNITATNTQGFDCSTNLKSGSVAYGRAFDALSNPDEWDINLLSTPGIIRSLHPSVTTDAIDMCEAREDVFYIADFVGATATIADAVTQADSVDSNYAGTYYPWVKTIDTNTNKVVTIPPSVLMPAVYAQSDRLGAEWFAPAGLNRGGIPGAIQVVNRLTHAERDTLYEANVNPIAAFPGQGISAFGQKTLQAKASALDRINVRRLLINLKKFVASTSRFLVFEQNTAQTRQKFLNTVNPYLESVQQRQGLYAFRVVMDETNNTPDVIDRNILVGAIYLQPTKTAEFIIIDFNVLPTGATFNV